MVEQPRKGDGEEAWRRYAAELRTALGDAQRVVDPDGLARARAARARAAAGRRVEAANERARLLERVAEKRKNDRLRATRARRTAERALAAVHEALRKGDVPLAFEVIDGVLPYLPDARRRIEARRATEAAS